MDLKNIPHSPGVYLMRDDIGRILYVGKAEDLAKRVRSYFSGNDPASSKIPVLVSSIHHIDYIPTASEREALLVERSLIRQLQPHFNTMWRDDKTHPYVKISWGAAWPQNFLTPRKKHGKKPYFRAVSHAK